MDVVPFPKHADPAFVAECRTRWIAGQARYKEAVEASEAAHRAHEAALKSTHLKPGAYVRGVWACFVAERNAATKIQEAELALGEEFDATPTGAT